MSNLGVLSLCLFSAGAEHWKRLLTGPRAVPSKAVGSEHIQSCRQCRYRHGYGAGQSRTKTGAFSYRMDGRLSGKLVDPTTISSRFI